MAQTYVQRQALHPEPNSVPARLFGIMARKQSNLMLAADVSSVAELLALAESLGPYICVLKMHLDLLDPEPALSTLPQKLKTLAQRHHFLLFEDRKYADIGGVTRRQWVGGPFHVADWVDLVTVHAVAGPGTLDAIASYEQSHCAIMVITDLSSRGSLTDRTYREATASMLQTCHLKYPGKVCGVITQHRQGNDDTLLYATPGVRLAPSSSSPNLNERLGQQYKTPKVAIQQRGADAIIVGSGILKAKDRIVAAKQYQRKGWQAYLASLPPHVKAINVDSDI